MILLVLFVGIQFVPTKKNQTAMIPITDFMKVYDVPTEVSTILKTSCYDCHSNNTQYPWYNKVQPVAWFLESHVQEGKSELNFNEWKNYSNRRKKSKLKSISSQIRKDKMPLSSYTFIHGDAKLSESKKELIIKWIDNLRDSL